MVDANLVESTERQKKFYSGSFSANVHVGQQVLLNNPAAGKLDPCWTGP